MMAWNAQAWAARCKRETPSRPKGCDPERRSYERWKKLLGYLVRRHTEREIRALMGDDDEYSER